MTVTTAPRERGRTVSGGRVLALICVAQFMAFADDTIVNVALPSTRSSLGLARTASPGWWTRTCCSSAASCSSADAAPTYSGAGACSRGRWARSWWSRSRSSPPEAQTGQEARGFGPDLDLVARSGAQVQLSGRRNQAKKPPLCSSFTKWRGWESNPRHHDFQSCALPTELPRRAAAA
jgi:hypothetical protein